MRPLVTLQESCSGPKSAWYKKGSVATCPLIVPPKAIQEDQLSVTVGGVNLELTASMLQEITDSPYVS